MTRPVIIRYPDGTQLAGAEYEIEGGSAVATENHPDAEITLFADDGTPYDPAKENDVPIDKQTGEPKSMTVSAVNPTAEPEPEPEPEPQTDNGNDESETEETTEETEGTEDSPSATATATATATRKR